MQHISPERMAALADEPATLHERAHLSDCAECTANLTAAQRLVQLALTDTPAIERPITSWERLGPALRAQGLVATPLSSAEPNVFARPAKSTRYRSMMQVAAGLFLAVGGAVVGRASAALPADREVAQGGSDAGDTSSFVSTTEAMNVLQRATTDAQRAMAFLVNNDSSVTMTGREAAELYRARLAAFDQSAAATRAALYRAPEDPMLKNLYTQSVGARDLTLRQMGRVVPVANTTRTRF